MRLNGSELPSGLSLPLPRGGLLLRCCDSNSRNCCWCSRFLIRKIFGIVTWRRERCTTLSLCYHYIEVVSEPLPCFAVQSRSRSRHNKQEHVWSGARHVSTVLYTTVSYSRVLSEQMVTTASDESRQTVKSTCCGLSRGDSSLSVLAPCLTPIIHDRRGD